MYTYLTTLKSGGGVQAEIQKNWNAHILETISQKLTVKMTVLAPCVSKVAHRMFYLNLDPEGGFHIKRMMNLL